MAHAIPIAPLNGPPPHIPLPGRLDCNQTIKKLALQTLAELAVSLSIALVVSPFVATPMGLSLLLTAIAIQSLFNLFIRGIGLCAAQKSFEGGPNADRYRKISAVASAIAPFAFAVGTAANGSSLIHETGHALMAKALYQNANPQIDILPFSGGATWFNSRTLTHCGRQVGKHRASALVAAAGPILSLSVSSILLASSFFLQKKHPEASRHLRAAALTDFLFHAAYSFSALFTPSTALCHDFVCLSLYGIHPLAVTAAIIATPILITLGARAIQGR